MGTDGNRTEIQGKGQRSSEAERGPEARGGAGDPEEGGWAGSQVADLGVDVHLSRAEQQTDHLQVPDFGCMVEAGGTVLLLREMRAGESPAGI